MSLAVPSVGSLGSALFIEGESNQGWKHDGNIAESHDIMEKVQCQGYHKALQRKPSRASIRAVS